MRRFLTLSVMCLGAGIGTGCTPEKVILTENIPTAGIRFVNAVPDTGAMDFRPVDIVENSTFYNIGFRTTTLLFYKNARAGSRKFRIFMTGTTQAPCNPDSQSSSACSARPSLARSMTHSVSPDCRTCPITPSPGATSVADDCAR